MPQLFNKTGVTVAVIGLMGASFGIGVLWGQLLHLQNASVAVRGTPMELKDDEGDEGDEDEESIDLN